MQNPKTINELLKSGDSRLGRLQRKSAERSLVLQHVGAALPPALAKVVVSAGIEGGKLTIGVDGASWAARLRYVTETLRMRVGKSMGTDIQSVRIKVVPPASGILPRE